MFALSEQEKRQLDQAYGLSPSGYRDENRFLGQAMCILRRQRPILSIEMAYELFCLSEFVQLWVQTSACRYSQLGRCTVCNYWNGQKVPHVVDKVISSCRIPAGHSTLLLNTCGSCTDPQELDLEEQEKLFAWIAGQDFQRVILETHVDMLDEKSLRRIRRMFSEQQLFFEFGVESVSSETLFYCLNKRPPKKSIPEIIGQFHACQAYAIINVLLGMPFLSPQEQVDDAVCSILELLGQGADYLVLFPVNIKPHTLPHFLHEHGLYDPVRGDMIVDVLSRIPARCLPQVDVAWYGDHQEDGTTPPFYCPRCQPYLKELIQAYNREDTVSGRVDLVNEMKRHRCDCPLGPSAANGGKPLYQRLDKGYALIQRHLFMDREAD